jgi:nicotinamidase-related amidase
MGKTGSLKSLAVLLIDMQEGFINSPEKLKIIPHQIEVLRFCKNYDIPVIIFEYSSWGPTIDILMGEVYQLQPKNVFLLEKYFDDAFSQPKLNVLLEGLKVTTLLLMGVNASYCVFSTARTAIKNKYKIVTSGDLIAGFKDLDQEKSKDVIWYQQNGVYLQDYETVIEKLKET